MSLQSATAFIGHQKIDDVNVRCIYQPQYQKGANGVSWKLPEIDKEGVSRSLSGY